MAGFRSFSDISSALMQSNEQEELTKQKNISMSGYASTNVRNRGDANGNTLNLKGINLAMKYIREMSPLNQELCKTSSTDTETNCTCNRSMKNILCRACGYVFYGRIGRSCGFHPSVKYLMDINCCPQCKAEVLLEFRSTKKLS